MKTAILVITLMVVFLLSILITIITLVHDDDVNNKGFLMRGCSNLRLLF